MERQEMCSAPVAAQDQPGTLQEIDREKISYNDLSRRDVRSLIFHLLYAAESFDYQETVSSIIDNFNRGFELDIPLESEVATTVQAIVDQKDVLDQQYMPFLTNWRFDRIEVSAKLILRFATWELTTTKTDPRIVINEAVELAKCFADVDAYRFVNGILDKLLRAQNTSN